MGVEGARRLSPPLPLLNPLRWRTDGAHQGGEMTGTREQDTFDAPGPTGQRVGDHRRGDHVQRRVTVVQPAAIQQVNRGVENTCGATEESLVRASTGRVGGLPALLEIPLELARASPPGTASSAPRGRRLDTRP